MTVEIRLQQLGVEMDSAVLSEWRNGDGDHVEVGDVIAVVETDKVTFDIESPGAGYLTALAPTDSEYPVGAVLALLVDTAAEAGRSWEAGPGEHRTETAEPVVDVDDPATFATSPSTSAAARLASPLARRTARENGIDVAELTGTGPGGAIRRADVDAVVAARSASTRDSQSLVSRAPAVDDEESVTTALTPMRLAIARRMTESLATAAQLTDVREVDASALAAFRSRANGALEKEGIRLSFTDLISRAVVLALHEHPALNATTDGASLTTYRSVALGVAVSIPGGLVVPVIERADALGLRGLHTSIRDAAERARDRRLGSEDLSGGTFTVTNIGSYGSHFGTPILNLPQVAILGVGAILDKPVVRNGLVVAGKTVQLSLTVDHRVIDGAQAGAFQDAMQCLIETPELLAV